MCNSYRNFQRISLLLRGILAACGLLMLATFACVILSLILLSNIPMGLQVHWLIAVLVIVTVLEAVRITSRVREFDKLSLLLDALTQSYHIYPPAVMQDVVYEMHKCSGREKVYETIILSLSGGRQASVISWTDSILCSEEYAHRSTRTTLFDKVCAVYASASW